QQQQVSLQTKGSQDAKELHMFVWSSSASPVSESAGLNAFRNSEQSEEGAKEIRMVVPDEHNQNGETNNKGTKN
ncbi:auxin efflux carrier component 3-like, partial [Trifolium medium]|nr:auxin efflux carrier component 3-like [Trifolium medium]